MPTQIISRRALGALSALAATLPFAALAAAPQPDFTPIPAATLAKAAHGEKYRPLQILPAPVSNETRAVLGADGKVRIECVTVRKSAFEDDRRQILPPTEDK